MVVGKSGYNYLLMGNVAYFISFKWRIYHHSLFVIALELVFSHCSPLHSNCGDISYTYPLL